MVNNKIKNNKLILLGEILMLFKLLVQHHYFTNRHFSLTRIFNSVEYFKNGINRMFHKRSVEFKFGPFKIIDCYTVKN